MGTIKIGKKEELKDDKMKITDLSDYCLEYTFNYLSLEDLINVARSNTILQNAALLLFKHKYGDMRVLKYRDKIRIDKDTISADKIRCFMLIFVDMIESIEYWHHTPQQHIHFNKLKRFKHHDPLSFFHRRFPFSFDQVEKLYFGSSGLTVHQIDEIIKTNKKLVKVTLEPNFTKELESIDKVKMLGKLPRITFESRGPWLIHDRANTSKCRAIVNFLNKNCFASKIKFKNVSEIKVLGKKLEENLDKNKWNITINKAPDGTGYTIIIKPKV